MILGKSGHCILEANKERGALYLSNIEFAKDSECLIQNDIKHIMTVGTKLQVKVNKNIIEEHIKFDVYDTEQDDIKQFFKQATLFLKEKIFEKKENVLVHCHQGVSRSASIVIAFLMKCLKQNYERSFSQVKRIRNFINPNKGFVNQLKMYERELGLAKKPETIQKKGKKSTELQRHLVENNDDEIDEQKVTQIEEYPSDLIVVSA